MSLAVFFKNNLSNISPRLGCVINKLPYSCRPGLGNTYRKRIREIAIFDLIHIKERREFIFQRMKAIVNFAYENIHFYKHYYDTSSFHPKDLKRFEDLDKIPITNKVVLNNYHLEERSFSKRGRYVVNTGGSSGTPFSFYIEPSSMGHEWAHMHTIWKKLDYKPSHCKIGFGGRSTIRDFVDYDVVRNTFSLDIYSDYREISKKLKKIMKRHIIKYLHGYPSSIYDFAMYCKENDQELQELMSKQLIGAFLGSEFPHPHYRDVIEKTFDIESISWYGHTERCALAYEKNQKYVYVPFQTYGYSEVVNIDGVDELVATSYYNQASPLIRYNTNDEIEDPVINNGILENFKIKGGRSGEFVIDRDGKKINLTGLIFGRHHEVFNHSKFIQVKQIAKGVIEIHYVSDNIAEKSAIKMFDAKNINMEISFVKKKEPVRTISGKIKLLIE